MKVIVVKSTVYELQLTVVPFKTSNVADTQSHEPKAVFAAARRVPINNILFNMVPPYSNSIRASRVPESVNTFHRLRRARHYLQIQIFRTTTASGRFDT